jgi:hypothetical protein
VGLLDKLFRRKPPAAAATGDDAPLAADEPAAAVVPLERSPDGVIVLREGMRVPDSGYVLAVAARAFGGAAPPEGLPHLGLSQPRWFKNSELVGSGAADAVAACAPRLGLDGCEHRFSEQAGPDGARVLLIELRGGARRA